MRSSFPVIQGAVALLAIAIILAVEMDPSGPAKEVRAQEVLGSYTLQVTIDGIDTKSVTFRGIEGIEFGTEVTEFRDGASGVVRRIPGRSNHEKVILRFDAAGGAAFWHWYEGVVAGKVQRATVRLVLTGAGDKEVVRYTFVDAWPCNWKGVRQVGSKAALPVEEIAFTFDSFQREP